MPREETVETLARSMGRLRDRLLAIALRNKQPAKTGSVAPRAKPRESGVPVMKPEAEKRARTPQAPVGRKAPPAKRPVPPQLKPNLFKHAARNQQGKKR